MSRAYQNGAQKIWIANVGDIKPGEYTVEFFLDLAWDINSIDESTIKKHLIDWIIREFGKEKAEDIADVVDEYYRLAFLRKPEYMGWSRTEPQTKTRMSEFNPEEIQHRLDAYTGLMKKVDAIKPFISKNRADAFFQLVEYPVKGAALMNQKFLFAQQSFLINSKAGKDKFANKSQRAYDDIVALTLFYNQNLGGGKWQNMMSMQPRNLSVYAMPGYHLNDTLPVEDIQSELQEQIAPIAIQAKQYSKAQGKENYQWKVIDGLGYSNSSVTLFPFENHIFHNEKPYVAYTFAIEKTGKYQLEVRCLPTHSNHFDHKIWIELNDKEIMEHSLNTKGRSDQWKENILRNFVSVTCPIIIDKTGKHTLKVLINQPGIVIDQIAITPEDHQKNYEIVN